MIAAALVASIPNMREPLLEIARWAKSSPELAWPLFLVIFVMAVVMMIPGWIFMIIGGYLFGAVAGGLLVFAANLAGSLVAFYVAKTYARRWVKSRIDHSPRFNGFDAAVSKNGFHSVMFARLALLPNNLINYACGVTGMSLRDFVLGTSIGCLPLVAANVLIGAGTLDLFATFEGGRDRSQVVMLSAIIAALAAIVILAKRYASRLIGSGSTEAADADDLRRGR
jgi:uncharacterized membrane protein YdjX (TVP38/TMEM64 family)